MKNKARHTIMILLAGLLSSGIAMAEVSVPPFYAAVSEMKPEGKLGQIIKREKIATPIVGAQAWRIAYISSDVADRKTIATGLIVAPIGKTPKEGRPIVSWSHGTTGSAQNCGPSQVPNPAVPLNEYFLVGGNSWTDYGIPALQEFMQQGYIAVATDYQGLGGGGGAHQYGVAATQGRDAINAIRAAGSVREIGASKKAIVYGWSQGGGSAIAAASSGDYINQKGTAFDGIDIVGFVALAPEDIAVRMPSGPINQGTADNLINGLATQFSSNVFDFTHLTMYLWGTQAAFPNLKLSDMFTDDGVKVVNEIYSNKCMHVASDTFNFNFGKDYSQLLKAKPDNTQAWAAALLKGSVAPVKPVAPVMIYFGNKDTTVPPVMGALYQQQMCKAGGNVGRMQLPGDQNHFTTPPIAKPLYVSWVKDRFAGKPIADGCATQ